jgi:hypothetical protein
MTELDSQIEQILSGPDYFLCEKMNCKMSKSQCARLREKAYRSVSFYDDPESYLLECKECDIGAYIAKEHPIAGHTSKRKMVQKVILTITRSLRKIRKKHVFSMNNYCDNCGTKVTRTGRCCYYCLQIKKKYPIGPERDKALEQAKKDRAAGLIHAGRPQKILGVIKKDSKKRTNKKLRKDV